MTEFNSKATWPGWRTVREIGRGSYGVVYEIEREMGSGVEKAALKVITIPRDDNEIRELQYNNYTEQSISNRYKAIKDSIINEYTMMRKLNGTSNVVNCDDRECIQHEDGIGWDIKIRMELLTET